MTRHIQSIASLARSAPTGAALTASLLELPVEGMDTAALALLFRDAEEVEEALRAAQAEAAETFRQARAELERHVQFSNASGARTNLVVLARSFSALNGAWGDVRARLNGQPVSLFGSRPAVTARVQAALQARSQEIDMTTPPGMNRILAAHTAALSFYLDNAPGSPVSMLQIRTAAGHVQLAERMGVDPETVELTKALIVLSVLRYESRKLLQDYPALSADLSADHLLTKLADTLASLNRVPFTDETLKHLHALREGLHWAKGLFGEQWDAIFISRLREHGHEMKPSVLIGQIENRVRVARRHALSAEVPAATPAPAVNAGGR